MRTLVYPGSFDPFTNGHVEVARQGLQLADQVIILIAENKRKNYVFSREEKELLIRDYGFDEDRVKIDYTDKLVVDYMIEHGHMHILRGVRDESDAVSEMKLAKINASLAEDFGYEINTVLVHTYGDHSLISSSMVREIASFGRICDSYVSFKTAAALISKLYKG